MQTDGQTIMPIYGSTFMRTHGHKIMQTDGLTFIQTDRRTTQSFIQTGRQHNQLYNIQTDGQHNRLYKQTDKHLNRQTDNTIDYTNRRTNIYTDRRTNIFYRQTAIQREGVAFIQTDNLSDKKTFWTPEEEEEEQQEVRVVMSRSILRTCYRNFVAAQVKNKTL